MSGLEKYDAWRADIARRVPLHLRIWNLDHIVAVKQGFIHQVPELLIASLPNLRIIAMEANRLKAARLVPEARQLLQEWGFAS